MARVTPPPTGFGDATQARIGPCITRGNFWILDFVSGAVEYHLVVNRQRRFAVGHAVLALVKCAMGDGSDCPLLGSTMVTRHAIDYTQTRKSTCPFRLELNWWIKAIAPRISVPRNAFALATPRAARIAHCSGAAVRWTITCENLSTSLYA